jgi:hypothetical protein
MVYTQEAIMAYALFTTRALRKGSPTLTITADKRIGLNADAGDRLWSVGAKFVQILWDAEAYRVALRPLAKPGESSYKLLVKKGKRGTMFSARTFLHSIGWNSSRSTVISIEWNEEEKLLEASLPRESFTGNVNSSSRD